MRVLAVSRDAALAAILEEEGHEVTDARPGDARDWGAALTPPRCDAAVIDIGDVDVTSAVVSTLLSSRPGCRLIVIGKAPPGHQEDVVALPSPLSRESLVAVLGHSLPSVGAQGLPDGTPAPSAQRDGAPESSIAEVKNAADRSLTLEELSHALGVEALRRISAQGLAVALPDGAAWRVHGGVHLRPIEQRMAIPAGHWLVTELLAHQRGAVIEHTDITRAQLTGAPLAAMEHLLIVTRAALGMIVIAARDADPFDKNDLMRLDAVVRNSEEAFRRSLALRELAGALQRFLT